MKILFFYQHFWPDSPPYANMLRTIASHFALKEYEVTVLTAQPSYKGIDRASKVTSDELLNGVRVRRLALLPGSRSLGVLRAISKASWPVRAAFYLIFQSFFGKRQDVVVAATIPPVANGLFGLIAAKLTGAKFVYHLQDIYPEIGAVGGLWPKDGTRYRLLKWFDTMVCKQADKCIVLSEDMAFVLVERGIRKESIAIINNFMLESYPRIESTKPLLENVGQSKDEYRFVFAGNLGRFQGLEEMLTAFLDVTKEVASVQMHFIGEGATEGTLKKMSEFSDVVFFHGHLPFEKACQRLLTFDAGIVSIQPNIFRYAFPSKTLTYLGLGLPMLVFVESESELSNTIRSNALGVSASNNSKQSLVDGFLAMIEFLESSSNKRERILLYAEENTSTNYVMNQWEKMFEKLENEHSTLMSGKY